MDYQKPQAMIYQQFEDVSTTTTEGLRAVIVGPSAILHRYADPDEKDEAFLGLFNPAVNTTYSYPGKSAGGVIDNSYTKLYIDNALLVFFDSASNTTQYKFTKDTTGDNVLVSEEYSESVSGVTVTIPAFNFKSTDTTSRSTELGERDVQIGDYAYVYGQYMSGSVCTDVTPVLSKIIGFKAEAAPTTLGTISLATITEKTTSDSVSFKEYLSDSSSGTDPTLFTKTGEIDAFKYGLRLSGTESTKLGCTYTITVDRVITTGGCANTLWMKITSSTGEDRVFQLIDGNTFTLSENGQYGAATIAFADGKTVSSIIDAYTAYNYVKWEYKLESKNLGFVAGAKPSTGASEKEYITFNADSYTGATDTYTVTCTQGNAAMDSSSDSFVISVSSVYGNDTVAYKEIKRGDKPSGSSTYAGLTDIAIGTKGLKMTIDTSALATTPSTVYPYIPGSFTATVKVTANEIASYPGIKLADNLPAEFLSQTSPTIKVKLIHKEDIELDKQGIDSAENWTATSTLVTVDKNATTTNSQFIKSTSGVVTSIPLYLFGFGDKESTEYEDFSKMYLEYREWSPVHSYDVTLCDSVSTIDSIIGPLDIDNPLKWGVYKALLNSNGATVGYIAVKNPSSTDSWVTALNTIENRTDVYTVVPLTTDTTVQNLVVSLINSESAASACRWKTALFSMDLPEEGMVIGKSTGSKKTSSDGKVVVCKVELNGTIQNKISCTSGNARFIDYGVKAGDELRIVATDGTITESKVVDEILSNSSLLTTTAFTTAYPDAIVEVWHTYTRAEEAELIGDKAKSFASRRVGLIWPDIVWDGSIETPGYFLCAALAGLKSGVAPERSLTRYVIQGFDDFSRSKPRYTEAQLNSMASNGVWICVADSEGSPKSRHAITTSTESTFYSEEMMTRNFDSISKYMYGIIDSYIGATNVTTDTLRAIYYDLRNACDYLINEGQMVNYTTITVKQHDLLLDRVVAYLNVGLPFAVNNVELYITAEAYDLEAVTLESENE